MLSRHVVFAALLVVTLETQARSAPSMAVGVLSPPSKASPQSIAEDFLSHASASSQVLRSELGNPDVFPVGDGTVVRYRQAHQGVPVIGGSVVLRIDGRGQVRRFA